MDSAQSTKIDNNNSNTNRQIYFRKVIEIDGNYYHADILSKLI